MIINKIEAPMIPYTITELSALSISLPKVFSILNLVIFAFTFSIFLSAIG